MKVYVLMVQACTKDYCCDWYIEGIFSSMEKAMIAKEKVENRPTNYDKIYTRIEDWWEVDKIYV